MNQWKVLIARMKDDFTIIRKDALYFIAIYTLLQIAGTGNHGLFTPGPQWQLSDGFGLLGTIVLSILHLLNLFYFQRQYSQKTDIRVLTHSFSQLLWNYIKVFVLQSLIIIPIVVALSIVLTLPVYLMPEGTLFYSTWIIAVTSMVALITITWFLRLLFLSNILLYQRTDYKMKWMISESKYLIKSRLPIVIGIVLLLVISSGSLLIHFPVHFYSPSIPWYVQLFTIAIGLVTVYIRCALTVHAVKDERESFMFQSDA
ncbi:hypothetical protein [Spirochaeta dissipatitropha]